MRVLFLSFVSHYFLCFSPSVTQGRRSDPIPSPEFFVILQSFGRAQLTSTVCGRTLHIIFTAVFELACAVA